MAGWRVTFAMKALLLFGMLAAGVAAPRDAAAGPLVSSDGRLAYPVVEMGDALGGTQSYTVVLPAGEQYLTGCHECGLRGHNARLDELLVEGGFHAATELEVGHRLRLRVGAWAVTVSAHRVVAVHDDGARHVHRIPARIRRVIVVPGELAILYVSAGRGWRQVALADDR